MQPRSPTKKKKNNGILRSQIGKPSITSRRLALDKGVGLKGALKKDASLKTAQAQAGDISVVAAVEQSQAHIEDSPSSEEYEHEQEQEQELEITPRRANKRLRSLFQAKTLADRENNKQIGDDDKEGEQDQPSVSMDSKETLDFMKGNIAQSIPPHLRQKFAAETVASIRRLEWVSDRQMIEEVSARHNAGTIEEATARTGRTKAICGQAQ